MKQCPFCGREWDGKGECPGCGRYFSEERDDSLFRRPEAEEAEKEIIQQESSSVSLGEDLKTEQEKKETVPEESFQVRRLPWKRWHKILAAWVLLVVMAVSVFFLWPAPKSLPERAMFFVKDDMVMAFHSGQEPRKITEYVPNLEYYLYPGRDGESFAWMNPETNALYFQPKQGEAVQVAERIYSDVRFSTDGRFLYYLSDGEENSMALFQYRIETGETRMVAGADSYLYYIFSRTQPEVIVWDENGLSVIAEESLEKEYSLEGNYTVLLSAENGLYFLEKQEHGQSLWRWQNGQKAQLLADSIAQAKIFSDGTGYYQCYTGGTVPMADRVKNDLSGEESEKLFQKMKEIPLQTPEIALYYFDGAQSQKLADNWEMVSFDTKNRSVLVRSAEFQDTVLALSSLYQLPGEENMDAWLRDFSQQMTQAWPYDSDSAGLLTEGKLVPLPEDFPEYSAGFTVQNGRICALSMAEDLHSINGLWVGELLDKEVENLYEAQGAENFFLAKDNTVFYGKGPSSETLYEENVAFEKKVRSESVQMTDDGTLYYLSGSGLSSWTLKSRRNGQTVQLAENVVSCEAFTRDYVLFLQQREDGSMDVMACVNQGEPELVAEGAEMLLRPQNEALGNTQSDYGSG